MIYTSPTNSTTGVIDELTMGYSSGTNKLATVTESASDIVLKVKGFNPGSSGVGYNYDASGNLITDTYKNITGITYNHLNLPSLITMTSSRKFEFTYDATGKQLRKKAFTTATAYTQQDYVDGIEYTSSNSAATPKVEAIYNTEGRLYNTSATATPAWRKEYSIRDHLGNTRVVFSIGNAGTTNVLQENHYYPFGLTMEGPWMNNGVSDDNRYLYNGKELHSELGLGWANYGARFADPSIGRWLSTDPMSEKAPNLTPYRFSFNNPISNIDPDGQYESSVSAIQDFNSWMNSTDNKSNKEKSSNSSSIADLSEKGGPGDRPYYYDLALAETKRSGRPFDEVYNEMRANYLANAPTFQDVAIFLAVTVLSEFVIGPAISGGLKWIANFRKAGLAAKTGMPAYETALAGGKHSGFLKNYLGRNADEINKAIRSMETGKQGIGVHLDKIANPTKYVPNWNTLRPGHQQSLINGWQNTVTKHTEQIQILKTILGN